MHKKSNHNKSRLGFTIAEIVVVLLILTVLFAIALKTITDSQVRMRARNSERNSDIAQMISAFEMYRSNNQYASYPPDVEFVFNCENPGQFIDGSGYVYLNKIPQDTQCPLINYYYKAQPVDCDGSSSVCLDYSLGAYLEGDRTSCSPVILCGTYECNYCFDSIGEK